LFRSGDDASALYSLRFASLASPQTMGLRPKALRHCSSGDTLRSPLAAAAFESERRGDLFGATTGEQGPGSPLRREIGGVSGSHRVIERLAAWTADPSDEADLDGAYERLAEVELGFRHLARRAPRSVARLWADAR